MTRRQTYMLSLCFLLKIVLCWSCPHHEKPDGHDGHEVEGKTDSSNTVPKSDDYKVICYYGSWAVYRPGDGKFPVENIDPSLCSHLIYGFAGLSNENKIRPLDPYNDLKENYGKGAFLRFNALKSVNKKLKTLIAIGGWNEGSIKYSNMASKPESRKVFVDSVVEFIEKYGFDGLDLDWEYPASRGGKPEDKQNLVSLMRELKQAFQPRGYLLTSAVSAGKWNIDPGYDIPAISQYLDIINVMAYDYHGGWENKTGHNAPLYARPDEVLNDKLSNVNFSINYWISKGAPRNKIVLGMGTYGRSFTLQRAEVNGLGAPAPQTGRAGPYTREAGSLGYNEICEMKLSNKQWTEVRDPYYLAPYAFSDRQWVGFDDVESITLKTQYAKAMQLGGAMIWSVETDDFKGKCGQKYPLLNAINQVFKSDSVVMPLPTPSVQDISTPVTKPWVSISSTPKTPIKLTPSTSSTWWPQPSPSSTSSWWPQPSSSSTESPKPSSSSTLSSVGSSVAQPSSTTAWPWAQTHSSPQSSTSTTTSTPKPGVPDHEVEGDSNKTFHCHDSGIYKHEKDCTKFYRCVPTNAAGVYNPVMHDCPGTTVFNPQTSLCDWVENVPECRNKVPNNFFRFHKSFGK